MRAHSFDLRGLEADVAPAPAETGLGAGISLLVHGLGISAMVVTPLLRPTSPPEAVDRFQAPLVRPITVSLPPPPPLTPRAPHGSNPSPATQSAATNPEPPRDVPALIVETDIPDPGPGASSNLLGSGARAGTDLIDGDCVLGALCGTDQAIRPVSPKIPHVGGLIREPRLVEGRTPSYPPIARAAGVSGRVVMEAHVTLEGRVRDIQVVEGHPLFNEEAIASVRTRRYEPLLLNGVPTDFLITITVAFNLRR